MDTFLTIGNDYNQLMLNFDRGSSLFVLLSDRGSCFHEFSAIFITNFRKNLTIKDKIVTTCVRDFQPNKDEIK